jgi:hypothetical protein
MKSILHYFGTDFDCAGHYFWDATGDSLKRSDWSIKQIPFSPEHCLPIDTVYARQSTFNGDIVKMQYRMFAIIAISGSVWDKRQGSKTVFFCEGELWELEKMIRESVIAQFIISKLPFKLDYKELNP